VDEQGTSVIAPTGRRTSAPGAHRRPRAWIVVAAGVALAASGGAYYYWQDGRRKPSEPGGEGSAITSRPPACRSRWRTLARAGSSGTTSQAGSVHAFEHAALYSKVSGFLKAQNVDIGDPGSSQASSWR